MKSYIYKADLNRKGRVSLQGDVSRPADFEIYNIPTRDEDDIAVVYLSNNDRTSRRRHRLSGNRSRRHFDDIRFRRHIALYNYRSKQSCKRVDGSGVPVFGLGSPNSDNPSGGQKEPHRYISGERTPRLFETASEWVIFLRILYLRNPPALLPLPARYHARPVGSIPFPRSTGVDSRRAVSVRCRRSSG